MKKYFGVLILIMTIQSCAKIEEVILLQNEDVAKEIVAKDYLPLDKNRFNYFEALNTNVGEGSFSVSDYNDYSIFKIYGDYFLEKSYFYGNISAGLYLEKIFVKMEGEDIVFKVEESHREVLINNNFYNVSISPYEFTIIKNESLLNDTWVENETMILEYSPVYSATQLANSYSNSTFTFKVVEIDEPKFVGNTDYSNTCTIEMVYNIEGFEDLKRSYTFARDFGLISFTVGDNEIAIN